MTPGWPQLMPAWSVTPAMHYTLVRDSSKFSIHMAFLRNLTTGWPQLTSARLWPHQFITLLCGVLSTKFGRHRTFLRNSISGWPQLTPAWPPIPAMSYTLKDQRFFLPNLVAIWYFLAIWPFDLWLTLADPCMTFDPSNALRSLRFGQGFFPPNLVVMGHC